MTDRLAFLYLIAAPVVGAFITTLAFLKLMPEDKKPPINGTQKEPDDDKAIIYFSMAEWNVFRVRHSWIFRILTPPR